MEFIELNRCTPGGELGDRCARLLRRLGENDYSPDAVYDAPTKDWPGDWLGRTILGQTLLSAVTGVEAVHLKKIIEMLPDRLNEKGYIGEIYPDGTIDEQQLSGHSWLLRGLCEYYNYSHDESVKEIASRIAENLYLPVRDYYAKYPLERNGDGGDMSGTTSGQIGAWRVSTDTGCAYIALDGMSAVYELTGDERFGEMVREMAGQFAKIDLLGIKAQTHASLTAARGILRLYGMTKDNRWLLAADRIFGIYLEHGMTDTYENYNWFGRPEWTEPCAVVDSFICAMQLYLYTQRANYIDTAQRILYNGIYNEQRPTGGMGCNSCATDGVIRNHCYEVTWCCTMRGGEGLARAAQYAYIISGNRIIVPYLSTSEADLTVNGCKLHISQTTTYPYEGKATFDIDGLTPDSDVILVIYQPRENEYYDERLTPDNCHIDISFMIPLVKSQRDGGDLYLHGNLILGCPDGETPDFDHIISRSKGIYYAGDVKLFPLGGMWRRDKATVEQSRMRVLF